MENNKLINFFGFCFFKMFQIVKKITQTDRFLSIYSYTSYSRKMGYI
jgi:hypothetical protein